MAEISLKPGVLDVNDVPIGYETSFAIIVPGEEKYFAYIKSSEKMEPLDVTRDGERVVVTIPEDATKSVGVGSHRWRMERVESKKGYPFLAGNFVVVD